MMPKTFSTPSCCNMRAMTSPRLYSAIWFAPVMGLIMLLQHDQPDLLAGSDEHQAIWLTGCFGDDQPTIPFFLIGFAQLPSRTTRHDSMSNDTVPMVRAVWSLNPTTKARKRSTSAKLLSMPVDTRMAPALLPPRSCITCEN